MTAGLLLAFVVNTQAGGYFGGKRVTIKNMFEQLSTTIIVNDVKRIFEELGPVEGAAVTLMMFGGMGTAVRPDDSELQALKSEKREYQKELRAYERELNADN